MPGVNNPRRAYVAPDRRSAVLRRMGNEHVRDTMRHARQAEQRGVARWANPYIASKARAWTHAWNISHGVCKGCDQCTTGTGRPADTLAIHVRKWYARNEGDM